MSSQRPVSPLLKQAHDELLEEGRQLAIRLRVEAEKARLHRRAARWARIKRLVFFWRF